MPHAPFQPLASMQRGIEHDQPGSTLGHISIGAKHGIDPFFEIDFFDRPAAARSAARMVQPEHDAVDPCTPAVDLELYAVPLVFKPHPIRRLRKTHGIEPGNIGQ